MAIVSNSGVLMRLKKQMRSTQSLMDSGKKFNSVKSLESTAVLFAGREAQSDGHLQKCHSGPISGSIL